MGTRPYVRATAATPPRSVDDAPDLLLDLVICLIVGIAVMIFGLVGGFSMLMLMGILDVGVSIFAISTILFDPKPALTARTSSPWVDPTVYDGEDNLPTFHDRYMAMTARERVVRTNILEHRTGIRVAGAHPDDVCPTCKATTEMLESAQNRADYDAKVQAEIALLKDRDDAKAEYDVWDVVRSTGALMPGLAERQYRETERRLLDRFDALDEAPLTLAVVNEMNDIADAIHRLRNANTTLGSWS